MPAALKLKTKVASFVVGWKRAGLPEKIRKQIAMARRLTVWKNSAVPSGQALNQENCMLELNETSKIGFGTYRVSVNSGKDHQVLRYALEQGCNLIDTASNYMNGHAEELIGTLTTGFKDIFIITKAGYIQGEAVDLVKKTFKKTELQENFIHFSDTFLYSLHPSYLQWQIRRSLKRLNRKYIDGFLLHNPEYYLKQQENPVTGTAFYGLLKQAFELLEGLVQQGIIRYYGISSNTLPASPADPARIDVARLLEIAAGISPTHHFKIIQFPFNLIETDALTRHQGGASLLELARQSGLVTFSNRPLNSQNEQGAVRFASYEDQLRKLNEEKSELLMQECLEIMQSRLDKLGIDDDLLSFPVVKLLHESWKKIGNPEAVKKIFEDFFDPFAEQLFLGKIPKLYQRKFLQLKDCCILFSKKELTQKSLFYRQKLYDEGFISLNDHRPLSVMACQYLLHSGVDHVLVGMKQKEYVQDFKVFFRRAAPESKG